MLKASSAQQPEMKCAVITKIFSKFISLGNITSYKIQFEFLYNILKNSFFFLFFRNTASFTDIKAKVLVQAPYPQFPAVRLTLLSFY